MFNQAADGRPVHAVLVMLIEGRVSTCINNERFVQPV